MSLWEWLDNRKGKYVHGVWEGKEKERIRKKKYLKKQDHQFLKFDDWHNYIGSRKLIKSMQDKYKENIYKLPETQDNETLENSHKKNDALLRVGQ